MLATFTYPSHIVIYTCYLSSCLFVGCTHSPRSQSYLYPSSFKLLLCWLRSLAAALQLEIYWVYASGDSLPCRRDPS
ncbi:hypothetical protein [Photorhabdus heterorhabditis]|uniref:hypothetical protein n=1 Tax=Photorhabdus heterorhabditis TaxID=880156 RepID=UPI001562DBED|nr:hypothetical protein [Photorhabdus heterorhabditis]NRN28052.1 hypothetical protein [Photorhabdus heterorhabditis subsp. aluminescens]